MSRSNARSIRPDAGTSEPPSAVTCPLCQKRCKHHDHLRCHLHEHHKKSVIIDRYLDALGDADC